MNTLKHIQESRTLVYRTLYIIAVVSLLGCGASQKASVIPPPTQEEIETAVSNLRIEKPTRTTPVSMAFTILPAEAKKGQVVTLLTKVSILRSWHIYAKVPKNKPFITSEISFNVPQGVSILGELQKPKPRLYPTDPSILVYKNEVYFTQNIKIEDDTTETVTVEASLYFQACDRNRCLSPQTKMKTKSIIIKN